MGQSLTLDHIEIRNDLRPGDLGWIVHRHGALYGREQGFGIAFEAYVAEGLAEFWRSHNDARDCVWIGEHDGRIVAFLLLMHRGETTAQLRYFFVEPEYRGFGLGRELLRRFVECLAAKGYTSAFLWTTDEQLTAAALYREAGFKLTAERPSTAFDKPLTELRFELSLDEHES